GARGHSGVREGARGRGVAVRDEGRRPSREEPRAVPDRRLRRLDPEELRQARRAPAGALREGGDEHRIPRRDRQLRVPVAHRAGRGRGARRRRRRGGARRWTMRVRGALPCLALFLAAASCGAATTVKAPRVEVEQLSGGFTITQRLRVPADVRSDYEDAVRLLSTARYEQG